MTVMFTVARLTFTGTYEIADPNEDMLMLSIPIIRTQIFLFR